MEKRRSASGWTLFALIGNARSFAIPDSPGPSPGWPLHTPLPLPWRQSCEQSQPGSFLGRAGRAAKGRIDGRAGETHRCARLRGFAARSRGHRASSLLAPAQCPPLRRGRLHEPLSRVGPSRSSGLSTPPRSSPLPPRPTARLTARLTARPTARLTARPTARPTARLTACPTLRSFHPTP